MSEMTHPRAGWSDAVRSMADVLLIEQSPGQKRLETRNTCALVSQACGRNSLRTVLHDGPLAVLETVIHDSLGLPGAMPGREHARHAALEVS